LLQVLACWVLQLNCCENKPLSWKSPFRPSLLAMSQRSQNWSILTIVTIDDGTTTYHFGITIWRETPLFRPRYSQSSKWMIMNFGHLARYKIEFRRVFRCRPKRDECLLGVGALLSWMKAKDKLAHDSCEWGFLVKERSVM
jgi:hypothetical protein